MKQIGLGGWANIAEIVSGFAVVVSLLVVAYTVSENTLAIRSTSDDAVYAALRDIQTARFNSPELAETIALLRNGNEISEAQKVMWEQYQTLVLSIWENTFLDHDRELMSDLDWQGWDTYFVAYFSDTHEGLTEEYWQVTQQWYTDDFAKHVSRSLFPQ